eukprot:TRINITY_DN9335_c0_g5_i2.p1 TRINITY_DN9335_c0_g5~~TRINITY_DN9335_c0_g5_i2.p1  ORF type:complete len:603 (+),score=207.75 TRINITY_DN9335_c0_g5_i2:130-1938(+)
MSEFNDSPSPSHNQAEEIKEDVSLDDFKPLDESGQPCNFLLESKRDHFETHDTSLNVLDLNENYPADLANSAQSESKQLYSTMKQDASPEYNQSIQTSDKPQAYSTTQANSAPYESEKKLKMEEGEQRMIIVQYESVLQQLAAQLEKQIKRNRELETLIAAQAQKSTKIIEVLREHAEKEIEELSIKLERSNRERDELKMKIGKVESEYKQTILEKEQENQLTAELKRRLDLDGMSKMHMGQVEESMRKVMGQINEKNIMFEAELRKKEEETFSLKNLNTQLKGEIEMHKEINKQLKDDYAMIMQRKGEVDSEMQRLTNKIYADEIASHKLLQENDKLSRAVASLNDAKEAMERSMEDIKSENMELKQGLADCDRERNLLATRLEKAHRDYQTLEIALMKAENTMKLQAETINDLQSDYNTLVEHEKSSIPIKSSELVSSPFLARDKSILEPRKVPERQTNQQELKTRYQEYKQRQNTSTLGDVFKWNDDSKVRNSREKNALNKTTEESETGRTFFKRLQQNDAAGSRKHEENSEQITKLQNSLQMLLREKQKLEKEYSKFPPKSEKVTSQKKRKEEIEFELDLNEKNIQRTKFKLREVNAL